LSKHWAPYDVADPRVADWIPLRTGRRLGRFARAGTLALAAFVVWLVAGRALVASTGTPPRLLLVGWDILCDTLQLDGRAQDAFRAALVVLWLAVPLWAVTAGFRSGPRWLAPARVAVGLAGSVAAIPLLVVVAVVAANLVLWALAVIAGLLLLVILLLRAATAPFRRW
jgi:hypothetical protein